MNIETVAANLRNTIAGKEQLLDHYQENLKIGMMGTMDAINQTVAKTAIEFLEINIGELKRILQDVEQGLPKPVVVKEKIDYAKAKAMGRKDYAHADCPDDCSKCEHFKVCVYPIMD